MTTIAKRTLAALSLAALTLTIAAATVVGTAERADAANRCAAIGRLDPAAEVAYVSDSSCLRIGVNAQYVTSTGARYYSHTVINSRSNWGYLIVGVGVAPNDINIYRGCSGVTWSDCSINAIKYSPWRWNTSWGSI